MSQESETSQGQNSYTNYQVFKNTFCVRKLATYSMLTNGPHPCTLFMYDWDNPILGRLGKAIPLSWPYWIKATNVQYIM